MSRATVVTASVRRVAVKLAAALSAVVVVAAGIVAASPAQPAQAYTGNDFNPGYIISDQLFYNPNALSQSEIQAFLDSKCAQNDCINVLQTTSIDKSPDNMCPGGYTGVANEPTAAIIYRVQRSCGIAATVLLVTLQKEQGLITTHNPDWSVLRKAMGYGCPDTSNCDAAYYGLFNQVYYAARQLVRYGLRTDDNISFRTKFQIGVPYDIQYSPNVDCGTQSVTVQNMATTALYYYTPYTPNAASLANLGGPGDGCSSYGNRNFWDYYYSWFGNPTGGIVPPGVTVSRIGGDTRFDTAVLISQANHPDPVTAGGVVYVANGLDYPDALSAAPAAAKQGAPLLLTWPDAAIPVAVVAEIQRIAPAKIVVAGGRAAISDAVLAQLASIAPTATIRRDGGADRYETSRIIDQNVFPAGATPSAWIATGDGFADALSASAAAGSHGVPVILVPGMTPTVDAATRTLLGSLGVTTVTIAGGTGVVSSELQASLAATPGMTTVTRVAGDSRYTTSSAINQATFTSATTVYLTNGYQFPDALAGATIAGATHSPMYLTPATCVFRSVLQDIIKLGAKKMIVLGGVGVVGSPVESFVNCN